MLRKLLARILEQLHAYIKTFYALPYVFFIIFDCKDALENRKKKYEGFYVRKVNNYIYVTWVKDSGSEVAPQALQMLCSTKVIANFWWGMQCLALHMSSASSLAICIWMRSSMFSKHSAASSMKPSWKRCWSKKLSARARLSASGGKAVSWENCNCANSSCNKRWTN